MAANHVPQTIICKSCALSSKTRHDFIIMVIQGDAGVSSEPISARIFTGLGAWDPPREAANMRFDESPAMVYVMALPAGAAAAQRRAEGCYSPRRVAGQHD